MINQLKKYEKTPEKQNSIVLIKRYTSYTKDSIKV